jgi:hypothetical protein
MAANKTCVGTITEKTNFVSDTIVKVLQPYCIINWWLYDKYFIYLLTDAIIFREAANAMTTIKSAMIENPLMVG